MSWQQPQPTITRIRKPKGSATASTLLRRTVSNIPIRVPTSEWPAIVTGAKTMFRTYSAGRDRCTPVVAPDTEVPQPCLLYSARFNTPDRSRRYEACPAVLLSHRQEPLGAITPEDLASEGYEFLPAFKRDWKRRYPKLGWRPWDKVSVLTVRPMDEMDVQDYAHVLFHELFGEWLRA